ncbi:MULTISPECIES: exopolyphosphatase [unclassified Clostridium]|uniref:exopolyphosphatase n=1 Tax=unclassified Clostridium TaxID=2614128 RepID=UPI0002976F14|nr:MULTISPECIES: exopolyphosphatase [unclassified Clostridium]EKQ51334.1 MAG: exopolyphosphatase [Clostridium sp. Maddingley MBC34-26]
MKNIAVIDIGSNSMRVLVYELYENNSFKIIDEEKRMTRLGQFIDKSNNLSKEGIQKLIVTLEFFKILCEKNNVVEIIVVATEAIRRADNKNEILSLVKEKLDLDIRILSGIEESAYGYLTIKSTMDINNALLIDIGGSSMEITLVKDKKIVQGISLPLGSIPLTKLFPFDGPADKYIISEFKNFIDKEFDKLPWLKDAKNLPLIGIGGTARSIGKIHKKFINYPLDLLHNYSISIDEIKTIYDYVLSLDMNQKTKLKGLPKERADIFTAPFSALVALMNYCSCPLLKISQYGIREGVLYERLLGQNIDTTDILDFSLNNILINNDLNLPHAEKIQDLSNVLLEYLENSNNKFLELENKILKVAAKLHDVGVSISVKHAYKHGFYIIINSLIAGLTHKEILMAAYTVALSGKFDYKIVDEYRDLLSKDDVFICKRLSIILCLAHKIDKYFYNSLAEVVILNEKDSFNLALPESSVKYMKDSLPVEMDDSFKKSFDKKLSIVAL